MDQWSILGNVVKYIQYDKHPKNFHNLNISAVKKERSKGNSSIEIEERHKFRVWRYTREIKVRVFRHV